MPFTLAVNDPTAYAAQFPNCDITFGDMNRDGIVDMADLSEFIALLTQPDENWPE